MPTQLRLFLDMLTIRQHKKSFDSLSVAIVGDIRHSRVARSGHSSHENTWDD